MDTLDPGIMRQRLLEKREEISATLSLMQESARPVDLKEPIGRLTRMDAMQQQQMLLSNKKQAQETLDRIEAALKRIESESFGLCLKCEEEISHKRLMALPEAAFCSDCQQ